MITPPHVKGRADPTDHAGFVSCDIVGHSGTDQISVQRHRIEGINSLVRQLIATVGSEHIVWASGGDGGHVALLYSNWPKDAIRLICELRQWADQNQVPLRIVAHVGSVARSIGADGRCQLIGDGINLAGRLLSFGVSGGVAVSDNFRAAIEAAKEVPPVLFHDERIVHPKYFSSQRLSLLSVTDQFTSTWNTLLKLERSYLVDLDRQMLEEALLEKHGWEAIYYAKRILQSNIFDEQALSALYAIQPHTLTYRKNVRQQERGAEELRTNPFFELLDSEARVQVIKISQLVERKRNEVLCTVGDPGNSMFIVLQGEIGIFPGGISDQNTNFVEPPLYARRGETVGEIAFTLKQNRTATLLAVTDASLLSLNVDQVVEIANRGHFGPSLERFLRLRVLKFICTRVPFLVGKMREGPLACMTYPWERMASFSRRVDCTWTGHAVISRANEDFRRRGIYLLVRGKLKGEDGVTRVAGGGDWPIVFVDLPGIRPAPQEFSIEEDSTIFGLDLESFLQHEPETLRKTLAVISSHLNVTKAEKQNAPTFDVFLSHNSKDKQAVRSLAKALQARGLTVWLDEWELVPGRPWQEKLEETIKNVRSAAVLVGHDGLGPWEEPEMRACLDQFIKRKLAVIPVLLPGCPAQPQLPVFLEIFTWVDLRKGITEDELDLLQWGITGIKPKAN